MPQVTELQPPKRYAFTKYVRLILPVDGSAFWVRADQVTQGARYNAALLNGCTPNEAAEISTSAPIVWAMGTLHYATEIHQDEVKSYSSNLVTFNAEHEIQDLNQVGPAIMFIGDFETIATEVSTRSGVRYAFSRRENWFEQAGIYHYVGHALYSDMTTQIVDSRAGFDAHSAVVSNSLPLWLNLNNYAPPYPGGFSTSSATLPLFPSFLVTGNLHPPFAAVHVASTDGLQAAPYLDETGSHWQLVQDRVRITTYGMRNNAIMDWLDAVNQYSLDTDNFGIMNIPVAYDDKEPQPELQILAQRKTIVFDVSYYQTRARNIARQLIEQAFVTVEENVLAQA